MKNKYLLFIVLSFLTLLFLLIYKFSKKEESQSEGYLSRSDASEGYLSRSDASEGYFPLKSNNFILGPVSLSYHTHPGLSQKIYIFGDRHIKDVKCPTSLKENKYIDIVNFLISLTSLKNEDGSPKRLDYFFEIPIDQKFNPREFTFQGYLSDIYSQFKNCLKINKEECQYKNIRLHYSDARFGIQEYEILEDFYKLLLDWNVVPRMPLVDEKVIDFWEGLTILFSNPEIMFESGKINKQIEDVVPEVRKFLETTKRVIINLFKELNDKGRIIYNFNLEPSRRREGDILAYWKKYSIAMQGLMDLYLFSRMFRKFGEGDLSRSDASERYNPKNIIIYTGESHSKTYRSWLSLLGFQKESESVSQEKGIDFQCLNISNFQQPFFS